MDRYPITRASFNLTRSCNLACSYCFTYGCTQGDMSWEVAKKGVDFLFNNAKTLRGRDRQVDVSFWGGEPLLKWSLLQDIARYAKEKSVQDAVPVILGGTTNGTLLTPEKFDFLDSVHCKFMVSFDGTSDSHNLYRKFKDGRGSHEVVKSNFKLAVERWPDYRPRMSLIAERVDHFYEDIKYLIDLGANFLVFSPVYEGPWDEEKWTILEQQGRLVVDYMDELLKTGREIHIQHFDGYTSGDNSKYPCGAGRFYVGIDIDGAIYPCHRFNKFSDNRSWQDKEVCIGHLDVGITRPEFRDKFLNFKPKQCGNCEFATSTPCNGGCYGVNFDLTGKIDIAPGGVCRYAKVQKTISDYYKEKLPVAPKNQTSCICYNMCYAEGSEEEIRTPDILNDTQCICYNTRYDGVMEPKNTRALTDSEREYTRNTLLVSQERRALQAIFKDIGARLTEIERVLGITRGEHGKNSSTNSI